MKATKRDLVGRKIVAVDWRRFDTGRGRGTSMREYSTDPRITLDDGSVIYFNVDETETSEYGLTVCVTKRGPKSAK